LKKNRLNNKSEISFTQHRILNTDYRLLITEYRAQKMPPLSKNSILKLLSEIPDPEIPVINILELGVVRDILINDSSIEVIITPTYSGCPAMKQMEDDILSKLKEHHITDVKLRTQYFPAWTTDWITEDARERLRVYGIAPPHHSSIDKATLLGKEKIIACPRCGSRETKMISQFGSTACKALYQCTSCLEPFDYFKCI
jgi:ring-1,2-phenylacetyl-CoA epoxidase subunit PaaD